MNRMNNSEITNELDLNKTLAEAQEEIDQNELELKQKTQEKENRRVQIDAQNKSYFYYRIQVATVFIMMEIFDFLVDIYNWVNQYLMQDKKYPTFNNMYTVATIIATISSIYVIKSKYRELQVYYRAIYEGVEVTSLMIKNKRMQDKRLFNSMKLKKGKTQVKPVNNQLQSNIKLKHQPQRKFTRKASTLQMTEDSSLELFIQQSGLRIAEYKCYLISAFFEDLIMFCKYNIEIRLYY